MKRCAVIGVGQFGFYHAEKFFSMSDVDLTVVDSNLERAIEVAQVYGCRYLTNYKELFDVEYVSIATPDHTHYEIANHFIEAGVNVLVEKPIATDLIQARNLIGLATQKGVTLQVGYLEAYNSAYKTLKQMVGLTGFTFASITRANGGNYDREGVDVVNDLMGHDIYLLLDLLKVPIVGCMVQGYQNSSGNNYQVRAVIEFTGGIQVEINADRATQSKRAEWQLLTTQRVIKADLYKKTNDTLFDQILEFVNGGKNNGIQAMDTLQVTQTIIDKTHGR